MIARQELETWFDIDFADFEANRMYPPNYERKPTMIALRQEHIGALTRAQNLLETAVDVRGKKKLENAINRDITLLCQLRQLLFFALENPTLPFKTVESCPEIPAEPYEP